jgi:hypothetical protein
MRRATLHVPCIALAAVVLAACGRTQEGSSGGAAATVPSTAPTTSVAEQATIAASTPPPPPSPLAQNPPAAFVQPMLAAESAIEAGDYAGADRQIDAAAAAAANDAHLLFMVARYRATRFTYSGDIDRAALVLTSAIPEVAKHPELPDEFSAHNQMMMIRVAQGNPAAALAEDDQATLAAARGTWAPEERQTLAYLKDRWHRAYLSRMLAETRKGADRQKLIRDAQTSLDDYRTRARQLGTNEDSIAVLEAYFAALDGKREAALHAAKKVDPSKDDDGEDLYLVVIGLEVGGDHAAAEAVRRKIREPGGVHLSRPILLRWLDQDAKVPRDKTFTPWHPT